VQPTQHVHRKPHAQHSTELHEQLLNLAIIMDCIVIFVEGSA